MLKIKTFECNVKANLDDDYLKVIEYFKSHNIEVVFERNKTNVKLFNNAVEAELALPNDGKVDCVMYLFNRLSQPNDGYSYCVHFSTKMSLIKIPTGIEEDPIGFHWYTIAHEIIHSFFQRLQDKGVNIVDPMDSYILNDQPYATNGNFSHAWKALEPYLNLLFPSGLYKPPNFKLEELVPKAIIDKLGEKAWELLDERMLRNLQFFRENLGPILVNSLTQQYRCFDPSEYRKEGISQHNAGRAVDCTFKNYTSQWVREWLRKPENASRLPFPDIWVELGTTHFHFDVRYSDKRGVYFFNP